MIIALINNKGGVGKTTSTVNIAAALAGMKKRVLLVDLDSQGSASLSLGVQRAQLSPSIAEVMLDRFPVQQAIRNSGVGGLDLLTGSMVLANADLSLASVTGRERRLLDSLAPVRDNYDYILIDCPPSLSLLSINALVAADHLIIPVTPHYLALEGLVNLMQAVDQLRQGMGTGGSVLGILLTMADYRTRVTAEIVGMIRGHYDKLVFENEVRVNVRLQEAPSFGQTIFEYDNSSVGAEAYRRIAKELHERCTPKKKGKSRK